jgi:hypothetical protein
MKTFAISILALAALSTASFAAGNHSGDLRDVQPVMGGIATTTSISAPLAVASARTYATNFDRVTALQNSRSESHSNH